MKLNQYNPSFAIDLFKKKTNNKNWLEKKRKLPRNIRYGLIDEKSEKLIKDISDKYGLIKEDKISSVSVLAREFLAGMINEERLKKEVYHRFQFNNEITINFLEDFKKLTEEIKKIGIGSVKKDLIALKFSELIEKVPEIKKQEIGIYDIYFPGENQAMVSSIENWIIDYKLRRSDKQEATILNVSNYLFNSPNTQDLDEQEKEQLSIILNSYEKNKTTYYNTLFEEIDYEITRLLERNKKKATSQTRGVNITKFESKPYHDTDKKLKSINNKPKNQEKTAFKPKPITKIDSKDIPRLNNSRESISSQMVRQANIPKPEQTQKNVLDLNKYI